MKKTLFIISVLGAAAGAAAWARKDYRAWRALGPGGLPSDWKGWLKMTQLRMQMDNPLKPRALQKVVSETSTGASLKHLPVRNGPRPKVAPHPVPHRQLEQKIDESMRARLQGVFDQAQRNSEEKVFYRNSYFEKHTPALTLRTIRPDQGDACKSCGEIAHIHPSDGSMHMILSPADASLVLEKGWGETHGLAGKALGLPASYMLIYAPRDEDDLKVVSQILGASLDYMTG